MLGLGRTSNTAGSTSFTRDDGGPLVAGRPSRGTPYYYLFDGLGSVAALTDFTGAFVRSYAYDPYGTTTTNTGTGPTDPFRYTSVYTGPAGLIHNGIRWYDPTDGRWTQPDPLDQADDPAQANRYAYVGDEPGGLTDSSGAAIAGCGGAAACHGSRHGLRVRGLAVSAYNGVTGCFTGARGGFVVGFFVGAPEAAAAVGCVAGAVAAQPLPTLPHDGSSYPRGR